MEQVSRARWEREISINASLTGEDRVRWPAVTRKVRHLALERLHPMQTKQPANGRETREVWAAQGKLRPEYGAFRSPPADEATSGARHASSSGGDARGLANSSMKCYCRCRTGARRAAARSSSSDLSATLRLGRCMVGAVVLCRGSAWYATVQRA
jgi:hypothetical protein